MTSGDEQRTDVAEPAAPTGAHPIEGLMHTAMASLRSMVDVNTVVGDAVETKDGTVIVPVSQVSLGFAAGGGEYGDTAARRSDDVLPFGGGSGAGVSVRPVGFLVVHQGTVRLLPVDQRASLERLLDLAPEVLDRLLSAWRPSANGAVRASADHHDDQEPAHAAPAQQG